MIDNDGRRANAWEEQVFVDGAGVDPQAPFASKGTRNSPRVGIQFPLPSDLFRASPSFSDSRMGGKAEGAESDDSRHAATILRLVLRDVTCSVQIVIHTSEGKNGRVGILRNSQVHIPLKSRQSRQH